MKVAIKVLVLVFAVSLAIGGVMIYAKTRVEPPVAPKQTNQFLDDLSISYSKVGESKNYAQEDSTFYMALNKIEIFQKENKISKSDADKEMDKLLVKYCPLFIQRSFDKFKKSIWYESDHKYMLEMANKLKKVRHSDGLSALNKNSLDSISQIESIIGRYNKARSISRQTKFTGVSNAQNVISQARQFANDSWLSNCTDLVHALNNVRPSIAESHYHYVCSYVDKLSQYRSYSQAYYENTLVPQVDAVVTEYDNKASALYGTKRDVNSLWSKARSYYNEASEYYN